MSFFYSESKPKLPIRGRKKLPMRGKRGRRLQLLMDFEPGRVYTFVPMYKLDDLPDEVLLWAEDDYPSEVKI